MANKNKPLSLKETIWKKQNKTKWCVINTKGKELEKFRSKLTAVNWKKAHELWFNEFSVVPIQ